MANQKYNPCSIILFAFIILCAKETAAQQSCSSTLIGLAPCLSYVSGNSSRPSSPCCASLASVVQTQPQCLCLLLNSNAGANLGVNINQTLALALPSQCNVPTPPASKCNAAGNNGPSTANAPTLSPVGSPSDSSNEPSETPSSPSDSLNEPSDSTPTSTTTTTPSSIPSGSKTVPKTNSNSADGRNIASSLYLMVATLVVAAYSFI